jgi:hypothetical protein
MKIFSTFRRNPASATGSKYTFDPHVSIRNLNPANIKSKATDFTKAVHHKDLEHGI